MSIQVNHSKQLILTSLLSSIFDKQISLLESKFNDEIKTLDYLSKTSSQLTIRLHALNSSQTPSLSSRRVSTKRTQNSTLHAHSALSKSPLPFRNKRLFNLPKNNSEQKQQLNSDRKSNKQQQKKSSRLSLLPQAAVRVCRKVLSA